jgi:hypothetical protein
VTCSLVAPTLDIKLRLKLRTEALFVYLFFYLVSVREIFISRSGSSASSPSRNSTVLGIPFPPLIKPVRVQYWKAGHRNKCNGSISPPRPTLTPVICSLRPLLGFLNGWTCSLQGQRNGSCLQSSCSCRYIFRDPSVLGST